MKFVFASYVLSDDFNEPWAWFKRIRPYAGIHKTLAIHHEVISIEQINYEGAHFENGVNYYFLKLSKAGRYFPCKLHRFIKAQSPDVVIIHGLHFPLQVIQLRESLGKKVKIIIQNHAEKPFSGVEKYLQRWADRSVDAYLFASREMGLEWVHKGNLASPHKIHEVMELSSVFYPTDKQEAVLKTGVTGMPVFLWVGRLNKNKDPLNVIKAFLRFVDVQSTARLYMIYHTEELLIEINELLKDHFHKDAVLLIGKVAHDVLLYWYNSADFIISGSHYEGSGTAICEAMSCGCIPVVTDIFSFRMITDRGNCGILYEPGNENALFTALLQTGLIDVVQKREKTLAYFTSNLSFEAIAERFQEIAAKL